MLMEKCVLFVYHRMPGSTFKECGSCNVHISVACKTCKHCGQKQEMKKATKAAKQKINDKWVKNMKKGNNFCKLVNAANVLMHKFHAMGKYPLLLLGKRDVSGCFTADVITPYSFLSPQEKVSIDTMTNIFSSVLKVKYSAMDSEINATVVPEGEGPSESTGVEDLFTLILTPVDLNPSQPKSQSSNTLEPPIKKRILEMSKDKEDSSAAVLSHSRASVTAATAQESVPKSIQDQEDSSAAVLSHSRASVTAATAQESVPKSIQDKEDSSAAVLSHSRASVTAATAQESVPKSIQDQEDSSAAVELQLVLVLQSINYLTSLSS
ncbi:uncharacterized protein [Pseudorasbora parva]|uniref:uncharacterized protein n=1 Tax=Pseudorasbora parva TaxID=51549 RepID=UPI00351ED09C